MHKKDIVYERDYIYQLIFFILMSVLILLRFFISISDCLIWVINYSGMSLAIINLLTEFLCVLKNKNDKRYNSFLGFCFLIFIGVIIIGFFLGLLEFFNFFPQKTSKLINDIITLLAVFFSLSNDVWLVVLDKISSKLK